MSECAYLAWTYVVRVLLENHSRKFMAEQKQFGNNIREKCETSIWIVPISYPGGRRLCFIHSYKHDMEERDMLKNWKFQTMWKNLIFNNNFLLLLLSNLYLTIPFWILLCGVCAITLVFVWSIKKNWVYVCCWSHKGINLNKPIREFNNNNKTVKNKNKQTRPDKIQ